MEGSVEGRRVAVFVPTYGEFDHGVGGGVGPPARSAGQLACQGGDGGGGHGVGVQRGVRGGGAGGGCQDGGAVEACGV